MSTVDLTLQSRGGVDVQPLSKDFVVINIKADVDEILEQIDDNDIRNYARTQNE
jgi:hypothetical protein